MKILWSVVAAIVVIGGIFVLTRIHPMEATSTSQTQQQQTTIASNTISGSSNQSVTTSSNNISISTETVSSTSAISLPTGSPWETVIPLGDYKYKTSGPEKGYIYLCNVASGGEGASGNPTWISGDVWYPEEKVAVEGSVEWPNATHTMTIADGIRTITSNDLPTDHPTGIFPIQSTDPAYQFDENPNHIAAQNFDFSLPAYPTEASAPQCIYGEVGIMNDGVVLFDGFDAEYRDAVAHETQDAWNGHPDQDDVYHDHGFEEGPVKESVSTVVGFAFDGYPITGSLLPDGNYLHTADLDECHGITSTIDLDGKSVTTYHYVLTQDFPYTVSCFRGKSYEPKPNPSESMGGMVMDQESNTGPQGSSQSSPPQAAIDACEGYSSGESCSFSTPNGTVSGTCSTPPNSSSMACIPN